MFQLLGMGPLKTCRDLWAKQWLVQPLVASWAICFCHLIVTSRSGNKCGIFVLPLKKNPAHFLSPGGADGTECILPDKSTHLQGLLCVSRKKIAQKCLLAIVYQTCILWTGGTPKMLVNVHAGRLNSCSPMWKHECFWDRHCVQTACSFPLTFVLLCEHGIYNTNCILRCKIIYCI